MDDSKKFATPQEEILYWRQTAEKFKSNLEDTREELEEFQISSRELEQELETQLEQLENKTKELTTENTRLKKENEAIKDKMENLHSTSHKQMSEMEEELITIRAIREELQRYIRELEQANDDLERSKRSTVSSLEDFEARLNQAIERNAFLESELDEKESLMVTVQRLKDEARDLRQELNVKVKPPDSPDSMSHLTSPLSSNSHTPVEHNKLVDSGYMGSQSIKPTPSKGLPTGEGSPLTPSARIAALNIVGDLIRKVGALESKLATVQNSSRDPSRSGKPSGHSPSNSPRAKRLNRGAPAPSQPGVKIPV